MWTLHIFPLRLTKADAGIHQLRDIFPTHAHRNLLTNNTDCELPALAVAAHYSHSPNTINVLCDFL